MSTRKFRVGQPVWAFWHHDGQQYPGIVVEPRAEAAIGATQSKRVGKRATRAGADQKKRELVTVEFSESNDWDNFEPKHLRLRSLQDAVGTGNGGGREKGGGAVQMRTKDVGGKDASRRAVVQRTPPRKTSTRPRIFLQSPGKVEVNGPTGSGRMPFHSPPQTPLERRINRKKQRVLSARFGGVDTAFSTSEQVQIPEPESVSRQSSSSSSTASNRVSTGRKSSLSSRLRSVSDLVHTGHITPQQKSILKDFIISEEPADATRPTLARRRLESALESFHERGDAEPIQSFLSNKGETSILYENTKSLAASVDSTANVFRSLSASRDEDNPRASPEKFTSQEMPEAVTDTQLAQAIPLMEAKGNQYAAVQSDNVQQGAGRRSGLVFDERMCSHRCEDPSGHPECPERILAIYESLASAGLVDSFVAVPARDVTADEVLLVHTKEHRIDVERMIEQEHRERRRDELSDDSVYAGHGTAAAAR